MNISIFTTYVLEQVFKGVFNSEAEAFEHFYNIGVRYADIVDTDFERYPIHTYCDYLNKAKIIPKCLVSTVDIASFDKFERNRAIGVTKAYIDQMSAVGIPILMSAPETRLARSKEEFETMRSIMVESLSEICEYALKFSIDVAIENQSTSTRVDSKICDIKYLLDNVSCLNYVYDPGNFFCVGDDPIKAYKLFKDKTIHCHIKDWAYDVFGLYVRENLPRFSGVCFGNGLVPTKEIIELMKKDNYSGSLVIEFNSDNILLPELEKCAEYFKQHIYGENIIPENYYCEKTHKLIYGGI